MTARQGAGVLSSTQRGPGPRAVTMAPPNFASENPILFAIRCNRLLDQIRHSDSSLQVLRTARLVGDLAAITSTLTMSFADLIFRFMSSEPAERLQQRFSAALQAVDTINDVCAQPLMLRDWFFSEEHCHLTARLLGAFTGSAGVLPCPPDHDTIFSAAAQPALLVEAPFLNTVFFFMLSRDLPPLALAQCLARARFGYWSNDRQTFFSDLRQSCQGLPIKWGIATRDSHDQRPGHGSFYISRGPHRLLPLHASLASGSISPRTPLHGLQIPLASSRQP
jgi:hypothetical protein